MSESILIKGKTISVATAARLLETSDRTIRYYCETGEIRSYKLGKRWRIFRESLDELIQRRMNSPIARKVGNGGNSGS